MQLKTKIIRTKQTKMKNIKLLSLLLFNLRSPAQKRNLDTPFYYSRSENSDAELK
jgi:hypothetical protein